MASEGKSEKPTVSKEAAYEIFTQFDKDKNGKLDATEIADLAFELGETLTEEEVASALKSLDKEGTGQVGFDGFYEWFSSHEEKKDDSSWQLRMLKARLVQRYYARRVASMSESLREAAKVAASVKDPSKLNLDLAFTAGNVDEVTGAALKLNIEDGNIGEVMDLTDGEGGAVVLVTFEVKDEIDEGDLYEAKGQIEMIFEEAPIPIEVVYPATSEGGKRAFQVKVCLPMDPTEAITDLTGRPTYELFDVLDVSIMFNKSMDMIADRPEEEFLKTLGFRVAANMVLDRQTVSLIAGFVSNMGLPIGGALKTLGALRRQSIHLDVGTPAEWIPKAFPPAGGMFGMPGGALKSMVQEALKGMLASAPSEAAGEGLKSFLKVVREFEGVTLLTPSLTVNVRAKGITTALLPVPNDEGGFDDPADGGFGMGMMAMGGMPDGMMPPDGAMGGEAAMMAAMMGMPPPMPPGEDEPLLRGGAEMDPDLAEAMRRSLLGAPGEDGYFATSDGSSSSSSDSESDSENE